MWLKATIRTAAHPGELATGRGCASPADAEHQLLIRQAEGGDARAFEKLASRYDQAILGLLLMLTSSEQDALDLCRATFLAAYHGLSRRKTESLYIWLYRLAAAQWIGRANGTSHPIAMDQLSARERLVFTLKTGQHLALRTVAQILEVPEAAVARVFSRAVCKLQMSAQKAQPPTDSCAGISGACVDERRDQRRHTSAH